jgi:hypothetical protein
MMIRALGEEILLMGLMSMGSTRELVKTPGASKRGEHGPPGRPGEDFQCGGGRPALIRQSQSRRLNTM